MARTHEHHGHRHASIIPQGGMAKDPICSMTVPKATSLKTERSGRTYYFCSQTCLNTFLDPEKELKSWWTRRTQ
jgi:P-type Cu+ transporter